MGITERNFLTLLSAGAFGTEARIEPMSLYKWGLTRQLAETYDVAGAIAAGILSAYSAAAWTVPKTVLEWARPMAETPVLRTEDYRASYYDIRKDTSRFHSHIRNLRHRRIVTAELKSADFSRETVEMLSRVIDCVNGVMYNGVDYAWMIQLGLFLRANGDKTDPVKAELWLSRLGLRRMANLVGSLLVVIFGFSEVEVPFMRRYDKRAERLAAAPLSHTLSHAADEPDGKARQRQMRYPLTLSGAQLIRRLPLFPSEALCAFVYSIWNSVSNIEE